MISQKDVKHVCEIAEANAYAHFEDEFWKKKFLPVLQHCGLSEDMLEICEMIALECFRAGASLGSAEAINLFTQFIIRKGLVR